MHIGKYCSHLGIQPGVCECIALIAEIGLIPLVVLVYSQLSGASYGLMDFVLHHTQHARKERALAVWFGQ